MNNDTLKPVSTSLKTKPASRPKGRLADLIAAGIAALSAILASIAAIMFFLGFAANDTVLAGLASAFVFSMGLAAFGVIPALIIMVIAYKGWREGLAKLSALWGLILSFPWVVLSLLCLLYTPLPFFMSFTALILSAVLNLWALISLILPTSRNVERP